MLQYHKIAGLEREKNIFLIDRFADFLHYIFIYGTEKRIFSYTYFTDFFTPG